MKKLLLVTLLLTLAGCAVNPVTGKKEFSLVSETQEIAIGNEQYMPARQSQGGDYVVDQQLTSYVNEVGQKLAAVSDRKLPYEFKVLNNSIPNAWALPGGKISINRGLLTELKSESELAAVLGHEIVHAAARHGASRMSTGMLLQAGAVGAALATQGKDYADLAQVGFGVGALLITQKYGRDDERESDYYGMQYMARAGYNPQGAVDLQETFVKLSEDKQQDWLSGLFASHPPSQERVNNNRKLLATLPKGGVVGAERYRSKVAHLVKTKPAYEDYDKGREALKEEDLKAATLLAQKALKVVPEEPHFHALLGDIEYKKKNYVNATDEYDRAITLNPDFFYYYLQRGMAFEQLGQNSKATNDLKRSVELLPTGEAYHSLGNLARKAGRLDEAKEYYAKIAGGQGELGQSAYGALVDMDLKDNPEKYINVKVGRNKEGHIVAQVSNPTPRNIGKIVLQLSAKDANGKKRRASLKIKDQVNAGKSKVIDLGLTGKLSNEQLRTLQVTITAADVVK